MPLNSWLPRVDAVGRIRDSRENLESADQVDLVELLEWQRLLAARAGDVQEVQLWRFGERRIRRSVDPRRLTLRPSTARKDPITIDHED